jgi:hypothetical protein
VSDLDGTLLDNPKFLSKKYVKDLNELMDKGLKFTIATGRDMKKTLKAIPGLNLPYPCILTNGALLADLKSQEFLKITNIKPTIINEILTLSHEFKIPPIVFAVFNPNSKKVTFNKGTWGSEGIKPLKSEHYLPFKEQDVVSIQFHTKKELLDPFKDIIYKNFKNETNLIYIEDVAYNALGYEGEWYWLEINSHEAGKAQMLRYLTNHLKIKMEDVIAFGDNHNDIGMLKAAGYGIAMENSPDELKAIADFIAPSNVDGGVIKYLKDHIDELL